MNTLSLVHRRFPNPFRRHSLRNNTTRAAPCSSQRATTPIHTPLNQRRIELLKGNNVWEPASRAVSGEMRTISWSDVALYFNLPATESGPPAKRARHNNNTAATAPVQLPKVRGPATGQRYTQLTHLTGRSHLRTATVQLENRFLTGPSRSERATARRARADRAFLH